LIVAFDASVLVFVITPDAKAPIDPATSERVTRCADRINFLIAELARERAKIIIPTPALAEVLVRARQAGPEFLRILRGNQSFRIASFDERAAVEHAARQTGGRAEGSTRAKAKFDDQIAAIAAVEQATRIYSDDRHIRFSAGTAFEVRGIADLPVPPEEPQLNLQLGRPDVNGSPGEDDPTEGR